MLSLFFTCICCTPIFVMLEMILELLLCAPVLLGANGASTFDRASDQRTSLFAVPIADTMPCRSLTGFDSDIL